MPKDKACLLRLLWLLGLLANAQEIIQEEEAIDFSIVNEGSVTSTEEVVSGVLLMYGEIDTAMMVSGNIDIVVKETLGKVCKNFDRTTGAPVLTKMYVDVRTVGLTRIGLNYSWQILPPVKAGKDCVNRLAMVGFGPREPPFDKYPAPPIRQLLAAEFQAHPPTRVLNTTGWSIGIQNMSCDERKVIKHWNHTSSIDVFPTEEPECVGGDSVTWEPNLEGEFNLANVGNCATAGGNACICAALPECEWVPSITGVSKCEPTARPGVPCDACGLQERCVMTDTKLCESKSRPCACVLAGVGCQWDMVTGSCSLDPEGSTACIACPRQSHCSVPSIRAVRPQNLALMGSVDVGWLVNLTFDREMEFMHLGIGSGILFQCRAAREGDFAPTFEMPYDKLTIDGAVLHLDVQGLPNDEKRDCDVVISDSAVRGADALLPFSGMLDNQLFITLPDGIPPQVNSFMPANSAGGVPVDPLVRIFFNEDIKFLRRGDISVYTLGGNQSNRETDKKLADLAIWTPLVVIDKDTLILDLTGLLSTTSYYSIAVPDGVLADTSNNPFPGLERGIYIFQTSAEERVQELVDTSEGETTTHLILIIVAGVCVGVVAVALGWMALEKVKKVRRRARVQARKLEQMEAQADVEPGPQLPHLNSHHDDLDNETWAVPASQESPKSAPSAKSLGKSPTSRPQVQVYSRPEEPKTQVHTQLREAGNVVSLAELHNKSSQMMRTIGGKVEDRRRRPGPNSAPSSPMARRHSALTQGSFREVPPSRRLHSAEGGARQRPMSREGEQNVVRAKTDGARAA